MKTEAGRRVPPVTFFGHSLGPLIVVTSTNHPFGPLEISPPLVGIRVPSVLQDVQT